jgi:hypothetical protein
MLRHSALEEIIALVVGKGEKKVSFSIHKNILCAHGPFFKAACKPIWMNPGDRLIELPEDDPDAIKTMVYWMYHEEICLSKDQVDELYELDWNDDGLSTPWGVLVNVYIAAEKFQIPRLKNDSVDALIDIWEDLGCRIPINVVAFAFDHTAVGSALRTLLIRMLRSDWGVGDGDPWKIKTQLTAEILFHLVLEMQDIPPGTSPSHKFCSHFHDHSGEEGGEECTKEREYVQH